jgi:hypothetical protein
MNNRRDKEGRDRDWPEFFGISPKFPWKNEMYEEHHWQ